MSLSEIPVPPQGFFVAHFLTLQDQAKSKKFYVGALGGKVVKEENPCYIKLENSWIILNSGGAAVLHPTSPRYGWRLRGISIR